jgi:anti-sigma factor RsiW
MNWTCEQIEARLSERLDGELAVSELPSFDAHVHGCERCGPLFAQVAQLLPRLRALEEAAEPPRLVYAILDRTLGPRESATGWGAFLQWLRGMASMRFAYGALSVSATMLVLLTASGFSLRKPRLADLSPVTIYRNANRQAHLVYARSTKFVTDMRVVYEIQSRLRQDNQVAPPPETTPGRTDETRPGPRQQNRANGVNDPLQQLAILISPLREGEGE